MPVSLNLKIKKKLSALETAPVVTVYPTESIKLVDQNGEQLASFSSGCPCTVQIEATNLIAIEAETTADSKGFMMYVTVTSLLKTELQYLS